MKKIQSKWNIYSMGIVFYQLATLKHPFEDLNLIDIDAWRHAHLYHNPVKPDSINTGLPTAFSQLITNMLEKSVSIRF